MPLRGSRRLHVAVRIEVARERRDAVLAAFQRRLGASGTYRPRIDAEKGEAHILQRLAVGARRGGESDEGVVAVAAGKLGEAVAAVGARSRHADRREDVALADRGLEQALEEIVRRDRAGAGRV